MRHKLILPAFVILIVLVVLITFIVVPLILESRNPNPTGDSQIVTIPSFDLVDTGQNLCADDQNGTDCPTSADSDYYGQDAQYQGDPPSYTDNNDGTITDNVTGLMWQRDPGTKKKYAEAEAGAQDLVLAGYTDWRLPSIKELYSLIDFRGTDPNTMDTDTSKLIPFIDNSYFNFSYGDPTQGDRIIDSQWATSTVYQSTVMNGQQCFFGVNFADGRIKCYPIQTAKGYFAIYVRGDSYGQNSFVLEGQTVLDKATGLTWQQTDSGMGLNWAQALAYCENLQLEGQDDWRLPNAKELQSIIDYSRSPDTTSSAAIDPVFSVSQISNEKGEIDFPFYWTATTHIRQGNVFTEAVYVSFGRALGYMSQFGGWVDVHGAGAQRSDPKVGDPADYPQGNGPQGDARRIYNHVRCVRSDNVKLVSGGLVSSDLTEQPQPTDSQQPPLAAVQACAGRPESSQCKFPTPVEVITGTCRNVSGQIACVP